MISYTFWCLFGAVAMIGKSSGTPIIVNYFFGTIVNAAFAVANQVESFILMFARSLGNAAIPQITKNFSGCVPSYIGNGFLTRNLAKESS